MASHRSRGRAWHAAARRYDALLTDQALHAAEARRDAVDRRFRERVAQIARRVDARIARHAGRLARRERDPRARAVLTTSRAARARAPGLGARPMTPARLSGARAAVDALLADFRHREARLARRHARKLARLQAAARASARAQQDMERCSDAALATAVERRAESAELRVAALAGGPASAVAMLERRYSVAHDGTGSVCRASGCEPVAAVVWAVERQSERSSYSGASPRTGFAPPRTCCRSSPTD